VKFLGIDVGGTGIKGALVELPSGEILAEHLHLPTPQPATPGAVTAAIKKMIQHFQFSGPVGVGFPGVMRHGVVETAVNLSPAWVGKQADKLFKKATRLPFTVINDADAAGLAEMHHGAGRKEKGTVVMITLGTGIGSAVFIGGVLVPNTEFGHLTLRGRDAETIASAKAREVNNWSWKKWSKRVREYLHLVDRLINPDLIIVGGGVSQRAEKWLPRASKGVKAKVVPAKLHNEAGIVGAAMAGAEGG
jgi:polyphosphate glucokinase